MRTDWAEENLLGRPHFIEDSRGWKYEFSEDGRHLSHSTTRVTAQWTYDERGRLLTEVSERLNAEDSKMIQTTLEWDAAGRPTKLRTVLGSDDPGSITTLEYDERGLVTLNDDRRYTYSEKGKLLTTADSWEEVEYLRSMSGELQVEVQITVPTQEALDLTSKVGTREEHTTRQEEHMDSSGRTVLLRFTKRGVVTHESRMIFDSVDAQGNWLTMSRTLVDDGERKEDKVTRTIVYWD